MNVAPSNLPELPVWHARSFWLTLLTVLIPILNASGIDLLGILGVSTVNQAVDFVMTFLPILTGSWAWFERRSPNYQLVFRPVAQLVDRLT